MARDSNATEWPFHDQFIAEKQALQDRLFAEHPLFQRLGFDPIRFELGIAEFAIDWQHDLSNYGYEMHGGIHATMIDTATGQAIFTGLKSGFRLTTVHLDVRYHRPFRQGTLVALGTVVKWGKTLCHATAELRCDDELIATGSSIYAVVDAQRRK